MSRIFNPPATFRLQGHDYELLGEINAKLPGIWIFRRPLGFDKTDPRDKEGCIAEADVRQAPEGFYYLPTMIAAPVSTHPYKDTIRATRQWKEGRDDLAIAAVESLLGKPDVSVAPQAIAPSDQEGSFDVTDKFPADFPQTGWTQLPGSRLPE
jgi:hypothetical protein